MKGAPCTAVWGLLLLSVELMRLDHADGTHWIDHNAKESLWAASLKYAKSADILEARAASAVVSHLQIESSHWRLPEMFPLHELDGGNLHVEL